MCALSLHSGPTLCNPMEPCQAPLSMGFFKQECGLPIPHGSGSKNQNKKEKQYCNKFIKDLKMVHNKKPLKIDF